MTLTFDSVENVTMRVFALCETFSRFPVAIKSPSQCCEVVMTFLVRSQDENVLLFRASEHLSQRDDHIRRSWVNAQPARSVKGPLTMDFMQFHDKLR